MCAGTEYPDSQTENGVETNGICPLYSLTTNMAAMDDDVTAILGRVTGAAHGDMLYYPDGYMTAWFCYYLKNDTASYSAFFGNSPEISSNTKWQNVAFNN